MRKIIFESGLSLDGFIEGPNGELGWSILGKQYSNTSTFVSKFDTIFCGRKAYEKFTLCGDREQWTEGQREFAHTIRYMRKYVFSRDRKHVPGNALVVSEHLEAEVKRIREEDGKSIWFCGGAEIFRTFADLDLIDEYILTIYPVMLRAGTLLFQNGDKPSNLELMQKCHLKEGVVRLHYRPQSRINRFCDDSRSF